MTETFRASDGSRIEVHDNNSRIDIKCTGSSGEQHFLSVKETQAAREFFQHECDEELGRWRWPDNPQYVVYPRGDSGVHVLDEGSGIGSARLIHRNGDPDNPTAEYQAAYAYFEAHPERKPWEDATYKDVWVWTTADNTQEALGWVAGDGTWDIITPKGDGIKAAERPVSALVEAGFEKFRGEVSGVKRIPEYAS